MIEIIRELATQSSLHQADVIISLIGMFSACIVAIFGLLGPAITFFLTKRCERKTEQRKTRENQYLDFLSSIAALKSASTQDMQDVYDMLSKRIQTIYLVGSNDVQVAQKEFLNFLLDGGGTVEQQSKLYAALINAMRKDLYGSRTRSLDSILLTTFSDQKTGKTP